MKIELPETCVIAMVGASGSGKSTFANKHFKSTEVLSSDYFRGLVSDDENNQGATKAAFDSLYYIANKRLEAGKLTVIDATNVKRDSRKGIIDLAEKNNYFPVAIVLNMPEKVCVERNKNRENRYFGSHVIKKHCLELKKSIKALKREGFRYIFILNSVEDVEKVEISRTKLWNNKRDEYGPFDIIGDIHGCFDELCDLLEKLNYSVDRINKTAKPPSGRKAVFLGDLIDRGPKIVETLSLVMNMVENKDAFCVEGNHDIKLLKKLKGADVKVRYGFEYTLEQIEKTSEDFKDKVEKFLESLVSHYVFNNGKLIVAHAGLKEEYHGRTSSKVKNFALYGETTGKDENGFPIRHNWAADYRGKAKVIYGHTPQEEVYEINNTVNIDTGCVFGGKLTSYSYPENKILSVNSHKAYYKLFRPFQKAYEDRDGLHIEDVLGKKYISTKLQSSITISEGNSAAALETISRFSADPRWLIYIPPTMSPCETSKIDNMLEHPIEAFEYYKSKGVEKVVCEEKHMGSRAVIIVCKDIEASRKRFSINEENAGIIYTRTGRHFFDNKELEKELLSVIREELNKSNFWEDFSTDWVCIDTELMPWSAKAQMLLNNQYAPVGCSGKVGLNYAVKALEEAVNISSKSEEVDKGISGQSVNLNEILSIYKEKEESINKYTKSYREYCWGVNTINDYKIAPFHILATEGKVYNDKTNVWHMETIKKYFTKDNSILTATSYIIVDFNDKEDIEKGISWWEDLTKSGGEGMVIKPLDFISENNNELLQPAVKCRGKEYLRIIYGPEYTLRNNLNRLKKRSLSKKRKLALKEFALGMESLERFVRKEPLYRVHECTFGVLAMESEPVDPRL